MMKLPIQMLGQIDTDQRQANLVFCHDEDRPHEAMLQWFGEKIIPGGVLVNVVEYKKNKFRLTPIRFYHCDEGGGLFAPARIENLDELLQSNADLKLKGRIIEGEWTGPAEFRGAIKLFLPAKEVRIVAEELGSWKDFKLWAGEQHHKGSYIDFRGHGSSKFPLKTTLHRAGRGRMERFCYETMPQFRDLAESILDTRFRPGDNEDFSVLLGLAQHHGLPTPLLDWSTSPYVAAFFAFSDAFDNLENRKEHTHVRIFALSQALKEKSPLTVSLTSVSPSVSYLAIPSRKNPRLLAQQGRFLVTNVSNLEGLFCHLENTADLKLVKAVDIPIRDVVEALEDLSFMGLSAATMFPGLDGACKMMRHAMAFRRKTIVSPPLAEAPLPEFSSDEQK
jgi:hypothetical protein